MFVEAALLGMVIGLLRGGNIKRLGRINLRGWGLALIALLIQAGLWVDCGGRINCPVELTPYLHLLSYLPLLIFAYINREQPGMKLIGLGLLLNLLVIAANGGAMPVDMNKLVPPPGEGPLIETGSPIHVPLTGTTKFPYLADIFRLPYGKNRLISWGDIALVAGLIHFIQQGMQRKRKVSKRRAHQKTAF